VNEQAHAALARLWELSTRKGMSPLVVSALARSLRHLDGVRVTGRDEHRARYVKSALVDLRAGVELMESSSNPIDREQRQAAAELAASLAPLEAWAEATLGSASDHPTRPGHHAAGHGDDQAVSGLVGRLGQLYRRRAAAVDEPGFPWSELAVLDRALTETLRALGCLGDRPLRWIDERPAGIGDEPDDLAAFAVCVHLGEKRLEPALAYLEASARPGGPLAEAAAVLGAPAVKDEAALAIYRQARDPAVRAALVPLLVERQRLSVDELARLVEEAADPPAVAAAEMLAWVGSRDQVASLLHQSRTSSSLLRVHASLFGALALGSPPALDEIRRRLDIGEASGRLVDALAVGGDQSDVRRLLRVAARRGRLARHAALAAGHLGSAEILAAARGLSVPFLEEALATTFGSAIVPSGPLGQSGRLWQGRPWSVAQALRALGAPETAVRVRERLALEIAVRSGVRSPAVYRAEASADAQARAAQAWLARWPGPSPSVAPWSYHAETGSRLAGR
jgi:hypothetical protein